MPKKTQNPAIDEAEPMPGERVPPPLSEEGVLRLQAAVEAARRRRLPRQNPPPDPEHDD